MIKENVLEELGSLISPVFEELNYELYYIEYVKENGDNYLRVYIDKPQGKVDFTDCTAISKRVNEIFDENEMEKKIDVDYLEVSSPGIYRNLHNDEHFNKVLENKIKVNLKSPIDGKKSLIGILKEVKETEIVVEVEGESLELPKDKIKSANLEGEV